MRTKVLDKNFMTVNRIQECIQVGCVVPAHGPYPIVVDEGDLPNPSGCKAPPWRQILLWTDWHTGVKTLPCPKPHLRPVINRKNGTSVISIWYFYYDWIFHLKEFFSDLLYTVEYWSVSNSVKWINQWLAILELVAFIWLNLFITTY